jgi:hypothetical protein
LEWYPVSERSWVYNIGIFKWMWNENERENERGERERMRMRMRMRKKERESTCKVQLLILGTAKRWDSVGHHQQFFQSIVEQLAPILVNT